MSKAVVCTGAEPTEDEKGRERGEWEGDEEVTDVTVADGLTEIKLRAFFGCTGLTNLRFLKASAITVIGECAFAESGVASLQWMEGVRKIGKSAFYKCVDLRTIEGLGCEEMGEACFAQCTLLQSMKGWPASMTVIPGGCFFECTGMSIVDCDISRVTSIGRNAFYGCTSLLPPSLSKAEADPAAVLAYLKEMASNERDAAPAAELEIENAARAAELTMEDIEAQIAALGLPPDFDPGPPPAAPHPAAPDAFMEMLLATAAPPAPAQQSLTERVRSLHLEVCGAEMPSGMGMAAAVARVEEGVLGGAREGGFRERVGVLEKLLSG
ncbi:hypothetical protein TeGR_g15220 [Tetraparma gracilis]|uniref:Uncharacterized protein n=1 Tax=Tetraparma gracilis TaxID=2962635 RepID=A0ABQ6MAW1_9STRA|nr:hypothetical protein TeGR_g15220 [Tetraparma gracilis]